MAGVSSKCNGRKSEENRWFQDIWDAAVTRASYEICSILDKYMKPFTDAEVVKECFLSASNVLFI